MEAAGMDVFATAKCGWTLEKAMQDLEYGKIMIPIFIR
jgi:hypothetical protein